MKKKLIICLSLLLCAFLCTTKVYAGDLSGLSEAFMKFAILFIILFIGSIVYLVFLAIYCSKRKRKQTKKIQKLLKKMKKWLYAFSVLLIIFSTFTGIYITLIIPLIGISIISTHE